MRWHTPVASAAPEVAPLRACVRLQAPLLGQSTQSQPAPRGTPGKPAEPPRPWLSPTVALRCGNALHCYKLSLFSWRGSSSYSVSFPALESQPISSSGGAQPRTPAAHRCAHRCPLSWLSRPDSVRATTPPQLGASGERRAKEGQPCCPLRCSSAGHH